MSLDPNVVPKLVPPPANFPSLGVSAFDGWNGPFWAAINDAFVDAAGETGGTLMESIARSNTQSNIPIIAANKPGTFLIGNEFWYTPSTLKLTDASGREYSIPAGAMLVREVQGESAYVPPVTPAVVLKAVFGMYYGTPKFSDGVKRKAWAAFNGTTYQPGDTFFDGGPSANVENPTGVLPTADLYEVVQFGMGQVIVEIGTTAVLPVTG